MKWQNNVQELTASLDPVCVLEPREDLKNWIVFGAYIPQKIVIFFSPANGLIVTLLQHRQQIIHIAGDALQGLRYLSFRPPEHPFEHF